jgi:epoxyqueuosine reductase
VRPADPVPTLDADRAVALVERLAEIAADHGITRTGIAGAEVLDRARLELHRRRSLGLHDGMQFTYKNPERSTDPSRAVRDARAVFVGARPYLLDGDPSPPAEGALPIGEAVPGRVARYASADHYAPLRAGLWAVAHELRRHGWRAVAFADDNSMVDREIAHRAGLGWFGKNANLLIEGAGSWFVLGSVVTDAPLPPVPEPVGDGCGTCRRCFDGCPTGAIIEPGVIDAARCLAWLLQKPGVFEPSLRRAVGDRIYGCDDCQEVCPPTVRLGVRHPARVSDLGAVRDRIDVLALVTADDDEVLRRWGRWYLAERDPRWVRRNALLVIGNAVDDHPVGDPPPPAIVRALVVALAHVDPMVRAHAVWAARRWGMDHLLPDSDADPDVEAELRRPVDVGPIDTAQQGWRT